MHGERVMIIIFGFLVAWNSIARVIDHFVNNADFDGMEKENEETMEAFMIRCRCIVYGQKF